MALGVKAAERRNDITPVLVVAHYDRHIENDGLTDIWPQGFAGPCRWIVDGDMGLPDGCYTQQKDDQKHSKTGFHIALLLNRLQKYKKICILAKKIVTLQRILEFVSFIL